MIVNPMESRGVELGGRGNWRLDGSRQIHLPRRCLKRFGAVLTDLEALATINCHAKHHLTVVPVV
jgi:hypothetical protein